MKQIVFVGIVAGIVIGTAAWGPCVPAAHAAPQQEQPVEAERIGIHLNVVVTQSVGESGRRRTNGRDGAHRRNRSRG